MCLLNFYFADTIIDEPDPMYNMYTGTVDPHISEGNGTDPTSYMLKIRIGKILALCFVLIFIHFLSLALPSQLFLASIAA